MGAEIAYIHRVTNNSDYLVYKPLRIELENPPIILKSELENATGFTPSSTRGLLVPSDDNITENHLRILIEMF